MLYDDGNIDNDNVGGGSDNGQMVMMIRYVSDDYDDNGDDCGKGEW